MPNYFAFGSNLSQARLSARVAIEAVLGVASLRGWRFVCDKHGSDESAKANLQRAPQAEVWGVLYQLDEAALTALDAFEGGYDRREVVVTTSEGPCPAFTYVSDLRNATLTAFDWYKAYIVDGALEHGLPPSYIERLRALPSRADPRR